MNLLMRRVGNKPVIDMSFLGGVLPEGALFSRLDSTQSQSYFDSSGVMRYAAIGAPRFDYDPVTHEINGLLLQPEARTNLLEYSQDLSQGAIWNRSGAPIITINNAGAPDGTATFNKFVRTTTSATYIQNGTSKATSSFPYTLTAYAKKGAVGNTLAARLQGTYPNRMDCAFNLDTGVAGTPTTGGSGFSGGSASMQYIGGGMYRCKLTISSTDTATGITTMLSCNSTGNNQVDTTDSVNNSECYLWGIQLEQALNTSSYIPTVASAVTRAADSLVFNSMPWFNPSEGTFLCEFIQGAVQSVTTRAITQFDDGSDLKRIYQYVAATTGKPFAKVGAQLSGQVGAALVENEKVKGIVRYKAGNNQAAFRGALCGGAAFIAETPHTGLTSLRFANNYAGSVPTFMYLRRFQYWNKGLTDAELMRLSA